MGVKTLPHDLGPHAPGGAELGHLLEQVVLGHEEEGQPTSEAVHVQPCVHGRLDVGDGVGEGEGQLLDGGGPRLPHVVAADADGVPQGHVLGAVLEHVHHQAHGGPGWVGVGAPGDVLLQDVVLDGAADLVRGDALTPGHRYVQAQQDGGGGVDGHGGADFVQGYPLQEDLHIPQAADGDPHLAHLAAGQGVVGVVPDLGGQIEGDGEARLALLQQVMVPPVGLLGGGVSRVLAHGPQPAPVHVGLDAAGVRVLAGVAQVLRVVVSWHILRGVDGLLLQARVGGEVLAPLGAALHHWVQGPRLPLVLALAGHLGSLRTWDLGLQLHRCPLPISQAHYNPALAVEKAGALYLPLPRPAGWDKLGTLWSVALTLA